MNDTAAQAISPDDASSGPVCSLSEEVLGGRVYDLVVIGAGSAGMSAAIYAGRARLVTLVLERDRPGGQIKITSEVENYPGVPQVSGEALSQTMRRQAEGFGVTFAQAVVERVDFSGPIKRVCTVDGCYEALAVVVATGAVPRTLGFKGEEEYRGRGIGYCATCDGEFFSGMDVFVVGGGFAAAEESLFLTRFARKVTLVVRGDKLSVPRHIAEKVAANPKVEVRPNTELVEVGGDDLPRFAVFRSNKDGSTWRYDVASSGESFGVFVFVGYLPQSGEYADALRLDEHGYIVTDEQMRTTVDGVYAAGDVRPKELRQLVTAVADGAIAATNAERYVEKTRARLGLPEIGAEAGAAGAGADTGASGAVAPGATLASGAALGAAASSSAPGTAAPTAFADPAFFDDDLAEQLAPVLERFERKVGLVAFFDGSSDLEREMRRFLSEFARLTDKVEVSFLRKDADPAREQEFGIHVMPAMALADGEGRPLGVQFHGVPAGHEINSFVLALYNASGPGQGIDEALSTRIAALERPVDIKVGVSLSCTLCPDVVAATQLMALRSPCVTAEMIDVAHFPAFKSRWNIMSVPAVVIDDERISFGKKSLEDLLALVES
ncbi:MAG: FAD-dependent oxidoreductase [Coriobacteriales bacterium]|jgi:thioredoxin reductase (NADPH)|nr:FAD-dependent oxidoreductase [Coriobacteriales bacterium]